MSTKDLVDIVERALTDEVYDGGFGMLDEKQLHDYTHKLAETAVEALNETKLQGEEEEVGPNTAVATAGEFALIWNTATPERRQDMVDIIMARQDEALHCFMADHDGLQEELAALHKPPYIDVVFNQMPGAEGCTFIEVEDDTGASIRPGNWITRDDGYAALRLTLPVKL